MTRAAAAAAALVLLAACNPQPQHQAQTNATPSPRHSGLPPLTITGKGTKGSPVTIVQQSGNRKLYRLVAQSVTSHSAQQTISQGTFKEPTVTFYDKDGTKLTARAPVASMQGGKQVVLSGGVHATTSTGLTLTCDRMTYDQSTGLVHGEGHVHITGMQGGQQQELTGNTFTSDVKLTQMVLK
jgi:LPS export ABC transporter protein LptC